MEWKKISSMEYGKIVFHSIPYHALAVNDESVRDRDAIMKDKGRRYYFGRLSNDRKVKIGSIIGHTTAAYLQRRTMTLMQFQSKLIWI